MHNHARRPGASPSWRQLFTLVGSILAVYLPTTVAGADICGYSRLHYGPLDLSCPPGQIFTDISAAVYGLLNFSCSTVPRTIPKLNCSAAGARAVVQRLCVGRNRCQLGSVAFKTDFGDPCPGQKKQLLVLADCAGAATRTPTKVPISVPTQKHAPTKAVGATRVPTKAVAVVPVTHQVNGDGLWTFKLPGAYQTWADAQTFRKGDVIVFLYESFHDVVRYATAASYAACSDSGFTVLADLDAGAPPGFKFTVPADGTYYIACSIPGHCGESGMNFKFTTVP